MGLTTCQAIDYSVIPNWNGNYTLPFVMTGFKETDQLHSSPYVCSIEDFYKRFCYTSERLELFKGLLIFRKYLYDNIIPIIPGVTGFQWVDGSFCQDKETSQKCPPKDIDVWTAFSYEGIPATDKQAEILQLINTQTAKLYFKNQMKIDAYFTTFYNEPHLFYQRMKWAAYWCGIWSHTRGFNERKGFCQIPLDQTDDSNLLSKL